MTRVAVLLVLLSIPRIAKKQKPPGEAELASITLRGRMMAEYDVAAWHATDAVQAEVTEDDKKKLHGFYVAQKGDKGWIVVFGGLNEKGDKYLVVYEAVQGASPTEFSVKKYDPPREDSGYNLVSARAIAIAMKDFERPNRPYNTYILPESAGRFYVYLLPAQTVDGVYPLGGDVRYLFATDGASILEKHQMHKSVLDFDNRKVEKLEAGVHTHVLTNSPEDSDVFLVLSRKPLVPEYVGTMDKYVYCVLTDGAIKRVK